MSTATEARIADLRWKLDYADQQATASGANAAERAVWTSLANRYRAELAEVEG